MFCDILKKPQLGARMFATFGRLAGDRVTLAAPTYGNAHNVKRFGLKDDCLSTAALDFGLLLQGFFASGNRQGLVPSGIEIPAHAVNGSECHDKHS